MCYIPLRSIIHSGLSVSLSVKSFVEMVKFIFTIPGVTTFLSERISQDPLETFFGCQRQRGGVNKNPNVCDFCKNTQALRVIQSTCISSVRGNCRGNKEPIDFEKKTGPYQNVSANITCNTVFCVPYYLY